MNFWSYTTSSQAGGHLSSFQIPLTFQSLNFLYDCCACLLSTCRQTRYHGDPYLLYTHLYNIGLGFSLLKKTKWKAIEEQQIYSWLLLVFVTLAKHRFSDPTIQDDSIPANWVMINNGRLHIDAILCIAFTFTRFLYIHTKDYHYGRHSPRHPGGWNFVPFQAAWHVPELVRSIFHVWTPFPSSMPQR